LYGPDGMAPPPPDSDRFAVVGGNEETRAKLLSTPGSVGPLSTSFVTDHPELAVVALEGVEATPETVASGRYPMSRPLYLVTDGPAAGRAKEFIDYVLSPQGQQLLTRHGYLTVAELEQ
ncbi:MAG: substrate-binding domain-containing protein, partial [Pseudonocardiaceae bacterium]